MADKRLSTPPGIAVYPRLKTPDTKYNDLGQYKADLALPADDPETKKLMDELLAGYKAHVGKPHPKSPQRDNRNAFYYVEEDEEGNETGRIVLKLRVTNKMNRRTGEVWDRRPKQFDAALKPIDVNIWGGSKMVVSFDVYEWNNDGSKGYSLQPVGVQVLELVSGNGADPSAMGFKPQEGFVSDTAGLGDDDIEDDDADLPDDGDDDDEVDGADY